MGVRRCRMLDLHECRRAGRPRARASLAEAGRVAPRYHRCARPRPKGAHRTARHAHGRLAGGRGPPRGCRGCVPGDDHRLGKARLAVRRRGTPCCCRAAALFPPGTAGQERAPRRAAASTGDGVEGGHSRDVAFQLVRAASAAIGQGTDTALTNWLGPMLLPDATARVERSHVYVELVTAPAVAVRRCYAGVVESCAAALGTVAGDRALLWYDAPERRTVVGRNLESAQHLGLYAASRACLDQESDAACLAVLHALPWLEPPLSNEARQSLARVALSLGCRRAFIRLAENTGRPLTQRLALAAAVPLDSLIHQWRELVIAARPRPVTLSARFAWAALGWSVVFGLLALRSTRWR